MTAPHEAVAKAIRKVFVEVEHHDDPYFGVYADQMSAAAIEALREGAAERVSKELFDAHSGGLLSASEIVVVVDAILGPPPKA